VLQACDTTTGPSSPQPCLQGLGEADHHQSLWVAAFHERFKTSPQRFRRGNGDGVEGVMNAISDGWIAAAVLARRECLATFDRDFVPLLPSRQLLLLEG